MAIIDPLFSILDYCDCNRLAPIGLWRMLRMIELYAISYAAMRDFWELRSQGIEQSRRKSRGRDRRGARNWQGRFRCAC